MATFKTTIASILSTVDTVASSTTVVAKVTADTVTGSVITASKAMTEVDSRVEAWIAKSEAKRLQTQAREVEEDVAERLGELAQQRSRREQKLSTDPLALQYYTEWLAEAGLNPASTKPSE